ncbi:efflux RND transporter periplasmic adaptor subunit [uncultured Caulobacter sp.]|uniref:efflux RND transporter periplasmic adaptor subunit n=1 Tax=uncultured Caulobacter sp. TaxID=158749 RepID=UPI00261B9178|nr:efflux RND transporter periplasmic adaptor subunit [uncultured Caulobacter sp.]
MTGAEQVSELPVARRLDKARQYRLVATAAGVLFVGWGAVTLAGKLLNHPPPAARSLPPGLFRPTTDQLAELKIQTVNVGADPDSLQISGAIAVDEDQATPLLLPYSGQVTQVLAQPGQRVAKGQPLLKIESPDFVEARNALFAAAAQHLTASALLRTAQDNATRQEAIYKSAGGAFKDYRQAQTDLVSAQSAMRAADAALGAARDKLALLGKSSDEIRRLEAAKEVSGIYAQTTFHAPIAGTIAIRAVSPGQYVTAGGDKPVMTIADLSRVWLTAQVEQALAAKVHLGDAVEVTTPAYPGRVFHAVVDNVGSALDPVTHRLPVRATVENHDQALKPGMFANFSIHAPKAGSAILVPAAAVIHEGDAARVWVARADGLLQARPVRTSEGPEGFERIDSGLAAGERIVTAGAIFVNEAGSGQ